jgi:hypothetical protein
MPFMFNSEAAHDANASIQFRVSGLDCGDYYLKCNSPALLNYQRTTGSLLTRRHSEPQKATGTLMNSSLPVSVLSTANSIVA